MRTAEEWIAIELGGGVCVGHNEDSTICWECMVPMIRKVQREALGAAELMACKHYDDCPRFCEGCRIRRRIRALIPKTEKALVDAAAPNV